MSKPSRALDLQSTAHDWANALGSGDRFVLSRLLTFCESTRTEHQELVGSVLAQPAPSLTFRIGLTGAPGVGKSTLLESLGQFLVTQGKRVAVLSVDPSSPITGGSILGDKTRMKQLSREPNAFVRQVPSGRLLGGLSPGIARSLELVDRAGFDVIFVETVGVGQSEVDISSLVDCLLLLVSPAAGDELQGFKRGIMEYADLVGVTRADLHPRWANETLRAYLSALRILDPSRDKEGLTLDALHGVGCSALWDLLAPRSVSLSASRRRASAEEWRERAFWKEVSDQVKAMVQEVDSEGSCVELSRVLGERSAGLISEASAAAEIALILRPDPED